MKKQPTIEGLENRVLFDGSQLTETILSSTLPASISDQSVLRGVVTLQVSNNSGTAQKFRAAAGIFIANGPLDIPSQQWAILRSGPAVINLANGASRNYRFVIAIPKGKLADGTDILYGVVTDTNSSYSQSPAGPTLTVHAPIVTLSETETFSKIPASSAPDSKVHIVDRVAITNSGTDTFVGNLDIAILATPDDTVASGTQLTSLIKHTTIPAGKTVTVPVTLRTESALGVGTYELISTVTQPNSIVTNTDPTTAPSVTIATPIVSTGFSDTILSATEKYDPDPLAGYAQHISELDLVMSIKNNGVSSNGPDQFTLFASYSPTLDSTATQENSLPLTLKIPHGGTRSFDLNFNMPDNGLGEADNSNYYIFVQVTDTSGAVTTASYPTPISFGGLIVG